MERVKLGAIFEIGSGGTPSKKHPEYYGGNIPWVKTGDLKSQYLYEVEDFISESGMKNSSVKLYNPNTVLVAMYGATIGATSILKIAACTNQACAAFKPNERILPEYLYYFLRSQKDNFVKDGVGGAQPNISASYLKNVKIPLRTLPEQTRITGELNKLTHIIDIKKSEVNLFNELIKARFVEMFGDPIVNPKSWIKLQLQQLVSQDCSISYGIVQTGDDVENGIPVFRPVDIVGRIPNRAELKRTARQISERYKRTVLKGRELLITVRANIADTFIAGTEFTGCNVGRGIVPIRTDESKIRLEFLKALIDCEVINRHIKSLAKGITLIQLNMEDLRTIELIVPPVSLQDEYIRLYKEVDKSKVVVQKSLEQTQLLFDSLMQQYFG